MFTKLLFQKAFKTCEHSSVPSVGFYSFSVSHISKTRSKLNSLVVSPQRHLFGFSSTYRFSVLLEKKQNTFKKLIVTLISDSTFSYRLELMRQIYNTAESPEMAIFQLLDMMPKAGSGETTPTNAQTVNVVSKIGHLANGPSSCKNTSRLSLANLLPSRLDNDLNYFMI